jgi:formate hydrogenlyase subunit 6/NADH:ubiquinone oxidoreductase subunit I
MGYFRSIYEVSKSILVGMNVTLKHMLTPSTVTTLQYVGLKKPKPGVLGKVLGLKERFHDTDGRLDPTKDLDPVRYYRPGATIADVEPLDYIPQRHRGLHYLESEKCIMCFQCSKACPVDCIDIEGTREKEGIEGGFRGDRATLTRFTIDYSLCIFCDHCTLACPEKQKCIIMGKEFDLSSYSQGGLVKNLLTDQAFNKGDRNFVLEARLEIEHLAAEKARLKAEAMAKKKAAAAAKKKAAAEAKAKAEAQATDTDKGEGQDAS